MITDVRFHGTTISKTTGCQVDAKPISKVSVNDIESERVATEVERELYWLVISDSEVCGLSDLASFQVDEISVMISFDVNGNGVVTTEATDVLDSRVKNHQNWKFPKQI